MNYITIGEWHCGKLVGVDMDSDRYEGTRSYLVSARDLLAFVRVNSPCVVTINGRQYRRERRNGC